jgi:hypothetical protein
MTATCAIAAGDSSELGRGVYGEAATSRCNRMMAAQAGSA